MKHVDPAISWVSPTQYTQRPDNPLPARNRTRMAPSPFAPVTSPRSLAGTPIGNLVVRPNRLEETVGGAVVWSASLRSGPGQPATVPAVAALVARSPHPGWLKQIAPGTYQLEAGLVQAPGTQLEVTAPEVTELRMVSQPYVYLAGVGASALFRNVKVTSWLPATNGPDLNAYNHRPFIAYDQGGRLDIAASDLGYLGTDATLAYSSSWGAGTTGGADRSMFHNNLFGAYTSRAVGVAFRGNVFRDNARYGLDPHTDSSGLVITDNEAYGNNTHGIIFSQGVNHSVIERNRSHDNGSNGIMMDQKSDSNLIRNNEAWGNRGDGIVLQGSSHNVVSGNQVNGNKVGVRIDANPLGPADGNRVANNRLDGNEHGIRVYGGSRDTITQGNQITNTADQAIEFSDPSTSQSDSVTRAHKAIVVDKAATVRELNTAEVGRGIVVSPGAQAIVESSHITGKDIAVEVKPQARIVLDGTDAGAVTTVSGARKGVLVSGTAELRNVVINGVDRGVLVDSDGHASITTTSIVTTGKGVEIGGFNGRGRVELNFSDVRAPQPLVGSTMWQESGSTLSAIPSWLALAGALFVLLAALLHTGHRLLSPSSNARHQWTPLKSSE